MSKRYEVNDLLNVMKRLRDPLHGCPWDLKQTPKSLIKYTIEECYELVDAIESGDMEHICEELGDVLLQVVFYAQLAQESKEFTFIDVVNTITEKLIRRHPHVFPDRFLENASLAGYHKKPMSEEDVIRNWEEIKKQEQLDKKVSKEGLTRQLNLFDNIPRVFPSLMHAQKIQKRASQVGFDFAAVSDAIACLKLEVSELEDAIKTNHSESIMDEMGDVLFSCVNVSRHLKLSAEESLRNSTNKFSSRMLAIESLLKDKSIDWAELKENDRDNYWSLVK